MISSKLSSTTTCQLIVYYVTLVIILCSRNNSNSIIVTAFSPILQQQRTTIKDSIRRKISSPTALLLQSERNQLRSSLKASSPSSKDDNTSTTEAGGNSNLSNNNTNISNNSHKRIPSLFQSTASTADHHHHHHHQRTQVRWEDLLQAVQPLTCDENDTECLLLQETTTKQKQTSHTKMTIWDISGMIGFISTTIIALISLIHYSGPGAWRYYLSGGICAATSHIIPVPIDVVKTKKQIDIEFANKNFIQTFTYILNTEGMAGLLSGLGPTAIGYLLEGAIKFGVYEVLKPIILKFLSTIATIATFLQFCNSKIFAYAISAALSGIAASIMLCPMEALRIRMVANTSNTGNNHNQNNKQSNNNNFLVTGYQILKLEGIHSLSRGMIPMMLKQVPYTVTKNVSFDFITRYAYMVLSYSNVIIGPIMKFTVPFVAAAFASILSCITSQPGDMLLSLSNAHSGDRRRTRDIIRDITQSELGIKGFFIGTKTRLLHVGIIVTLQLLIYDFVKRLCGIAATGMT